MGNKDNVSTGNAGELERIGITVVVPMSNVKDFDILAINRWDYFEIRLPQHKRFLKNGGTYAFKTCAT